MKNRGGFVGDILAEFWIIGEYFTNFLDDLYVIAGALTGVMAHHDLFNFSLLLGKALKITF